MFFVIFRIPLSELISRATRASIGNQSIDFSSDLHKSREQEGRLNAQPTSASSTIPASHAMPPFNEVYDSIEKEIFQNLETINLPRDLERAWLIRAIADWRTAREYEILYRIIFGSQIELINTVNSGPALSFEQAKNIYGSAKNKYEDFYNDISFEHWLRFPLTVGLINLTEASPDDSTLSITAKGRDFLHYLVNNSLSFTRYG
jgi:hypothetical protein